MSVQDTSLIAYFGEVVQTLGQRQRVVLEAFTKKEDFTNAELAEFLQWPINTVTPRTNELVKKGLIVEDKRRICKVTGRTVIAWKLQEQYESHPCCVSIGIFGSHGSECAKSNKKEIMEELKQATLL
jgi:DNA-binding MarR family transcriptional regulator